MVRSLRYKAILLGILSMNICSVLAQESLLEVYSFDDLPRLQSEDQRPIFVFLTADWCRYCKNVEQNSFQNSEVVDRLNNDFYIVIFDIEERNEIKLFGQNFRYKSTGLNTGVHELAELIGTVDGVLNTPTFVMFDQSLQIQYQYGGYMSTNEILKLLETTINM